MCPVALLLLPSLLALLAHGKGHPASGGRTGAGAGAGSWRVGREDCSRAQFRASGCPAQAPCSAGCSARCAGRAGRGAGSASGKLPLLPPFAPGRDLAFNHLSGSNGISLLQFITPPASPHTLTRSPARCLSTLQASRSAPARAGGGGHRAMSPDRPAGGPRSRLPCRPPNFVRLCRPFRGFSHPYCGGTGPDGCRTWSWDLNSPLSALVLPHGRRNLELQGKTRGAGDPYPLPHCGLGYSS